jgi:hypothetical protein
MRAMMMSRALEIQLPGDAQKQKTPTQSEIFGSV